MTRILLAAALCSLLFPLGASASEPEVEIVRGEEGSRPAPKVIDIPEADRDASPEANDSSQDAAESDRARSGDRRSAKKSEDSDEARARRQKELEELARRTQEEFRRAANALKGQ